MQRFIQYLLMLASVISSEYCFSQGTITFDGPPQIASGSGVLVQYYAEAGMVFTPINSGSTGFVRENPAGPDSLEPYDGTTYVQAGGGSTLMFSFSSGSSFGLSSVQLAGYSYLFPNFSVDFVGFRPDGSTITNVFSGTGLNFQTFYFGSDWSSDLTRVEIPNEPWSLDNLVVTVPEPGTGALLTIGALAFGLRGTRDKTLQTGLR